MGNIKGHYHSIDTFGTVDGPGIRYVLFLSGCKLQCSFCHNPDTWVLGQQTITVHEVLQDYARYQEYYAASGGGITISGGEPLLQADFVRELFKACQEQHIHTVLDTAGDATHQAIEKVLPFTDLILGCIKVIDDSKHRELTASSNNNLLDNFRVMAEKSHLIIRYVIIPTINDTLADMLQLAEFTLSLSPRVKIELLPYHTMGIEKWQKLGKEYKLHNIRPATEKDLEQAKNILESQKVACFY